MDNAALRALRAGSRLRYARRGVGGRRAYSENVARRHTNGIGTSHTRFKPACGFRRLRVRRIFYRAAHGAEICGGAAVRAGGQDSGVCSGASLWAAKGAEYACDAVALGITVSQISSLICAFLLYKFSKRQKPKERLPGGLRALLRIALPDAAGSCARSVLLTLEHLLIPVCFRRSGQSAGGAMTLYGVIHGMALPVILYPAAIMTALSSMLVPEFAECAARGNKGRIDSMAARAIKIAVLFSMGTAGIMFIFSEGLSQCIYGDGQCAEYLRVLAPLLPIMYTDTTVDGILKGLDQQIYSMRYNIIDSAMCVALVLILIPKYSVKG